MASNLTDGAPVESQTTKSQRLSKIKLRERTHVRQQVKEGVAAERAHRQGHQEGEQELEAGLPEDGDEHHAQQRQQADDGDGHKARQPHNHWERKRKRGRRRLSDVFSFKSDRNLCKFPEFISIIAAEKLKGDCSPLANDIPSMPVPKQRGVFFYWYPAGGSNELI